MPMSRFWPLIVAIAVVIAVSVRVYASWRSLRAPAEIERWLRQRGLEPQRMERRWLTRGPFADIRPAGVEHSGLLYYLRALERGGAPVTGWIWLPPGWQMMSSERWRLHMNPGGASKPGGVGTPLFALMLLVAAAVVLAVVSAIVQQHR
jgi:hypothetical protein